MGKPVQEQMVVLGDMTLGGVVNPVEDLTGSLQLAMDSCGKRIFQPYQRRYSPSFKSAFMLIRWMPSTRH
jgi:predicted ATP-dependent Lon-type protease